MVWIGSPNFNKGRGGKPVTLIVVHHMAGTLAGADAVFQDTNRNTSAHYGVGRNGEIHQYVLESDTAFHAGVYDINQRSIGIEHEDLNADNYTDLEYATSAKLIREICLRYNLPINADTIRPHRAFVSTACPGALDLSRLITLAQGGEDMLTKEEIIVTYDGFFDTDDYQVPQNVIDAFTGKPFGELLTYLHQDPSWLAHKQAVNNPPQANFVKIDEPVYRKA